MGSSETPLVDSHNQIHPEIPIAGSETLHVAHAVQTETHVVDCENQHHAENPIAGNQTPPNVDQPIPVVAAQRIDQAEIRSVSIQKISLLSSILGYTNFEEFVRDAEMLTLAGIDDFEQASGVVVFAEISRLAKEFKLQVYLVDGSGSRIGTLWDRMVYNFINKSASMLREEMRLWGKKCLFRLDVPDYNIRNNTSEISVARVTTDEDVIRKYLDAISDDQEIHPELSVEFCHNLTPLSESTAKTAVSCTDDIDMGAPGDETGDGPPPKKNASIQCGKESVKSHPNKHVKKF
ncbi:OLC1v1019029C1 [Oldenlandia corymbosa var. corymbosa]|uniref:OLC1v1019029C1 n=1 Tax=Oldenlandia corymbosa var. corymbosa TaxID=529605 RepID=A0AAV1EDI3_OLDCO|nr:OLC1v1019029C1 [Oldenlandia corymbosa var. corymbosa]